MKLGVTECTIRIAGYGGIQVDFVAEMRDGETFDEFCKRWPRELEAMYLERRSEIAAGWAEP